MIDCMGCEYAPMDIADAEKPCASCKATASGLKSRADVEELAWDQACAEANRKNDAINKMRWRSMVADLKEIYTYEDLLKMLYAFACFDPDDEEDGCPLKSIPYECPFSKYGSRDRVDKFYEDYCKASKESHNKFREKYDKYNREWVQNRKKAILRKWEKAFDNLPVRQKGEEDD